MKRRDDLDQPKYRISVIAQMLDMHPQTIRTYEKLGLINPSRSKGNTRLFSDRDRELLGKIQILTRELGVNLAGVEIILNKIRQIEMMNQEASEVIGRLTTTLISKQIISADEVNELMEQCNWLNLVGINDRDSE